MLAILLSILNVLFIVLIIIPLKIALRVVQNIDSKIAKKQLQSLKQEQAGILDKVYQLRKDERNFDAQTVNARFKVKKTVLNNTIALRRSSLKALRFVLSFFQFTSLFSGTLVAILMGVALMVAVNTPTLIPVWHMTINGNQSDNSDSKDDTSDKDNSKDEDKDSDSKGNTKAPNTAVDAFLQLKSKLKLNDTWANAFIGNMMAETGGGTYTFKPEEDSEHGNMGGLGVIQWTVSGNRSTNLRTKPNYKTLSVQIDFIGEELNGSEKQVGDFIKANPDISLADATRTIAKSYERCGAAYVELRIPYAEKFKKDYVDNKEYEKFKS